MEASWGARDGGEESMVSFAPSIAPGLIVFTRSRHCRERRPIADKGPAAAGLIHCNGEGGWGQAPWATGCGGHSALAAEDCQPVPLCAVGRSNGLRGPGSGQVVVPVAPQNHRVPGSSLGVESLDLRPGIGCPGPTLTSSIQVDGPPLTGAHIVQCLEELAHSPGAQPAGLLHCPDSSRLRHIPMKGRFAPDGLSLTSDLGKPAKRSSRERLTWIAAIPPHRESERAC